MMWKKFIILTILLFNSGCDQNNQSNQVKIKAPEPVPIIDLPYYKTTVFKPGWEERGIEFVKYNSTGVRIGGGSGTMSYYDADKNWMYVISCGHLFFQGRGSRDYYQKNPKTMRIDIFYQNDKKMETYKSYEAEVLCHVWESNIYDVSLLRFKIDWKDPWTIPVVDEDFELKSENWYHNIGCDGMTEVAHYLVKFYQYNTRNGNIEIICTDNVARGGRSGGGLLTDDRKLIGITSRSDRISTSYYSSYRQIYKFLKEENFEFVVSKNELAREIPIIDRNSPQKKYPREYIPIPSNNH